MRFGPILFLCADPALVREQLAGRELERDEAGVLRDDVSTDEISPLPAMVHSGRTELRGVCGNTDRQAQ